MIQMKEETCFLVLGLKEGMKMQVGKGNGQKRKMASGGETDVERTKVRSLSSLHIPAMFLYPHSVTKTYETLFSLLSSYLQVSL